MAGRVGCSGSECLHSLLAGLHKRDTYPGLRFARRAVDYRAINCCKQTGHPQRRKSEDTKKSLHAIALPHSPQYFNAWEKDAPQCGQTVPPERAATDLDDIGFAGTRVGVSPSFLMVSSVSAKTSANSF